MKSKVVKFDVNKLAPIPVDLNNLSEVVKTVVKKTECDELLKSESY